MLVYIYWDERIESEFREDKEWGDWKIVYNSKVLSVRTSEDPNSFSFVIAEVPDKTSKVWVVSVTYSTGDTFGNSEGNLQVANVFSDYEEAEQLCLDLKRERETTGGWKDQKKSYLVDDSRLLSYPRWRGYFESIGEIRLEEFEIDSKRSRVF